MNTIFLYIQDIECLSSSYYNKQNTEHILCYVYKPRAGLMRSGMLQILLNVYLYFYLYLKRNIKAIIKILIVQTILFRISLHSLY